MSIQRIHAAPGHVAPVGPYSQAVVGNGLVFTSGQIPARTALTDQPAEFADQVRQTLENLRAVLEEAGSDLAHVLKVNTYLTDPGQLDEYNTVYEEFFGQHKPARTSVCVSLWGVSLEIECVAAVIEAAKET